MGQSVMVHRNWLIWFQQMTHSLEMWPSLTFRWQSGGMHCNQIGLRREWIQQYVDGYWKMDPNTLFKCQLFPVTPLAPGDLLKLVRCSCISEIPCNTHMCFQQCKPYLLSVLCISGWPTLFQRKNKADPSGRWPWWQWRGVSHLNPGYTQCTSLSNLPIPKLTIESEH